MKTAILVFFWAAVIVGAVAYLMPRVASTVRGAPLGEVLSQEVVTALTTQPPPTGAPASVWAEFYRLREAGCRVAILADQAEAAKHPDNSPQSRGARYRASLRELDAARYRTLIGTAEKAGTAPWYPPSAHPRNYRWMAIGNLLFWGLSFIALFAGLGVLRYFLGPRLLQRPKEVQEAVEALATERANAAASRRAAEFYLGPLTEAQFRDQMIQIGLHRGDMKAFAITKQYLEAMKEELLSSAKSELAQERLERMERRIRLNPFLERIAATIQGWGFGFLKWVVGVSDGPSKGLAAKSPVTWWLASAAISLALLFGLIGSLGFTIETTGEVVQVVVTETGDSPALDTVARLTAPVANGVLGAFGVVSNTTSSVLGTIWPGISAPVRDAFGQMRGAVGSGQILPPNHDGGGAVGYDPRPVEDVKARQETQKRQRSGSLGQN